MRQQREFPAPVINKETQAFWEGTKVGKFMLKTCITCNKTHWYPRAMCPFCHGDEFHTSQVSGQATIYSYSVMRRTNTPFAIAYVTLEEGPTLLTNLIDCNFDGLAIGQQVQLAFVIADDNKTQIPVFKPVV